MKGIVSEFDIAIRVKPELTWIRPLELTARSYLEARSFPRKLVEQISAAIVEATEQLISLCIERDVTVPFEVGLAWEDEAVQVHLVYDASIPLNPHQEQDYEVPSTGENADSALEGLWLYIIKRTIDRVFFRVDGKRASLVMMKYCRAEQLARQSWVMGLKPMLRADLVIEHPAGEMSQTQSDSAILHDTRGRVVLKLSPSDVFLISRFNGQNTVYDIYLEHAAELGLISPLQVQRLYEALEGAGMLESRAAVAAERKQWWRRWLSPIFSIPRPDAAVTWVHRRTRFLFNPIGVAALVLIGLSGLIPLFKEWNALVHHFVRIDTLFLQNPALIALVYLVMLGGVAMHEFAHGVTCKHFGGQIKNLGVMWYMAMFIFFCDTTSAWTFPRKAQRLWVSLAGPLVSWAFFGVTAWGAGLTVAAASPWAALWIALLMMNAFGLVMNFNPLIRMDAYYMLVDWTDIPNLQKRSFDYLRGRLIGWLKKGPSTAGPAPTLREKRFFLIYGVLSAAMSFAFIVLPFWQMTELWVTHRKFSVLGVIIFAVVALLIGKMLLKAHALLYTARHQEYKLS